jgi:hypothetical protein
MNHLEAVSSECTLFAPGCGASPQLIVAGGPRRTTTAGRWRPLSAGLHRYRDHGRREAVGVERAPVGIASRARRTEVGRAEVGRGGRRS